jgi:hypothetical protein
VAAVGGGEERRARVGFVAFFGQRPSVLGIGEVDRLGACPVFAPGGDVAPARPAVVGPVDALVGLCPPGGARDHFCFKEVARADRFGAGGTGRDQEERAEQQR